MSDAPSAAAAAALPVAAMPAAPSSLAPVLGLGPIHAASSGGYSHEANALYDSGRPAYADETVDWMLHESVLGALVRELGQPLPTPPPAPRLYRLLDVGAGTGIFTRCVQRRLRAFEAAHAAALAARGVSFEVVGVEPVEGMRRRFREKCPADLSVVAGSGAAMPTVPTASVDVVFAAQSFHWFATVESLREMARVLRPGGCFAPVWNTRDPAVPWVRDLERIVDPLYAADVPRQQTKHWRRVFEQQAQPAAFELEAQREWRDQVVQRGDDQMVVSRVLTLSVVAARPQAEQDDIAASVRDLLRTHPDLQQAEGKFELPYVTDAYIYRRTAAAAPAADSTA